MSKKTITKIVLGAVVFNDDKILILQRSRDEKIFPNMWELPSGKKEPLETTQDSLAREVKEETGLNIKIADIISVFDYQIEKEGEIRDSTQINFLVKPIKDTKVSLSSEHQDYAWIDKNGINQYNLSDKTKQVILKGFEILKNIRINKL